MDQPVVRLRITLQQELDRLQSGVQHEGELALRSLRAALNALCSGEMELADEVIRFDDEVDAVYLDLEHGVHALLARQFRDAVAEAWGKPLTMNVSMPIAAVMLDLGFAPAAVKAVPILARTAGLLAHLAEEQQHPVGFLMAGKAEAAIEYERESE